MDKKESDIIEQTIRFWSNRYGRELSVEDGKEIVHNTVGFLRVLQEWKKKAS
jgi:hypothetical protein